MLSITKIRANPEHAKARLVGRLDDPGLIDSLLDLDERRRQAVTEQGDLRRRKNENARATQAAGADERQQLIEEGRRLNGLVAEKDSLVKQLEAELYAVASALPNVPHPSVPVGPDATANVTVSEWGAKPSFDFAPRPHWQVGELLGLDIPRGARMAGSRFYALTGDLALLELALAQFMFHHHVVAGYRPVIPPYLVDSEAMHGCAQLPKFEDGLYSTPSDLRDDSDRRLYLIPTAESAMASMHRGEILDVDNLPLDYVAFSPCFRRETSAGGSDSRGIKRVHQFHKVELFKFTRSDTSYHELESLTESAESILQLLELPYRKVVLSTGDMGFGASKTYDLEVWIPSEQTYSEISSCSNVQDFQARRLNIRYRGQDGRTSFVHMLNGSGLAVGRTMIAILENHQRADGSVYIPEPLRPYLHGRDELLPNSVAPAGLAHGSVPGPKGE